MTTDKKTRQGARGSQGLVHDVAGQRRYDYNFHEYTIERRSDDRVMVRDGIYAVIESLSPQICQIRDMSEAGLSFVYFSDGMLEITQETIDFLVTGFGFTLVRIPFRVVDDFSISTGKAGLLEKRMASIEFTDCDENRKQMIRDFIAHFIGKTIN